MEYWQAATAVFFGYVAVVAVLPRGLSPAPPAESARRGGRPAPSSWPARCALPADGVANVWLLPPAALLIGYWTSGLLFVAPMPRAERALARMDEILAIDAIAARTPRPIAEVLELAYVGVYPLIPIALYLALREGVTADRFWTVILLTDYVCFGMLPWIQTRPPRAVGCRHAVAIDLADREPAGGRREQRAGQHVSERPRRRSRRRRAPRVRQPRAGRRSDVSSPPPPFRRGPCSGGIITPPTPSRAGRLPSRSISRLS